MHRGRAAAATAVRGHRDLQHVPWAAVNHYDTEHPHAHVVIRGVDRDGQELRLDRAYISNGLRWRAQELATQELGPRLEVDVQRARDKEFTQDRFTSLDRELERRASDHRIEVTSGTARGRPDESRLVARLEHLEGLHLAERGSPTSWSLRESWQQRLRDLGSRGDILKQIHDAISGDPARYHVLRRGNALETDAPGSDVAVTGRVPRDAPVDVRMILLAFERHTALLQLAKDVAKSLGALQADGAREFSLGPCPALEERDHDRAVTLAVRLRCPISES